MKTVGLIVEYNPLHNGHVYHCQQSRIVSQADAVVAVMSGHFLQRGEPALVSKWARAEMALQAGVDLVLELPVAYSSQPAEWFAYGAISALDATGVVDALCFGSELGDITPLARIAEQLATEPEALRPRLKERLTSGVSYPAAFAAAAAESLAEPIQGAEALLAQPNNILGLHYLIALRRLGSLMEPMTVRRTKAGYHQSDITDVRIASATALRKLLFDAADGSLAGLAPYVPASTLSILEREFAAGRGPVRWTSYARTLLHQLLTRSPDELETIAEITEGLEHRLKRAVAAIEPEAADPVESLLAAAKTKRYTHVKLQRALTRILLGHRKQSLDVAILRRGVPYLRVLGFTDTGRELLRRMKRTARVPIVTKATKGQHPFLDMDIDASGAYALGFAHVHPKELLNDYYQPPIKV